jgi:4-amino-4-deoxy-L-arabinose transferase-like glycosyltransferase
MHWLPWLKPHWPVTIILLIYTIVTTAHSLVAPLTIGNDEWAHFLYTRFIAEHGRLPANLAERENKKEVGTKSDDPPLYHLLTAAAASGVEPVRLLRPVDGDPRRQLADNVVVSYAFLVHNGYELFPFRGEVYLWYIGRTMSIMFGGVVIILTYLTGLVLLPRRKQALTAAAFLAFIPAFIFHSSVMSYDSLGAVFTALFLLVSLKAIQRPSQWRWWIALGITAGLAVTTKYTSVLLPLEIIVVTWLALKIAEPGRYTLLLSRIMVAGLAMMLATSWWFGFVIWRFNTIESQGLLIGILEPLLVRGGNDSTAISVTAFLFGADAVSADLPEPARARNYPQLIWLFIESFWSAPIAEQFLLSPWLPGLFSGVLLWGLAGLSWAWRKLDGLQRAWLILLIFHAALILPLIIVRLWLSFDPGEAVQGRHLLFPGASALAILWSWGWTRWGYKPAQVMLAGLLVWSVVGQLGWAAVVYPPPMPIWTDKEFEVEKGEVILFDETFPIGMRLIGATWRETPPQRALEVALWWRSEAIMKEDYLVELRLLDELNNIVSYALEHPVQGRYPTRAWEPADVVKDVHWLPLAGQLEGVYQLQLRLLNRAGQPLAEDKLVSLGQASLSLTNPNETGCATWFQGRPDPGSLFSQPYRQRSTFTLIGPTLPVLKPGSSEAVEQKPLSSVNNFHIFVVGPEWAGSYRLFLGSKECHDILFELPARDFRPPEIPSPLVANFNNEVQLLGYELPTRRIQPGGRLPLVLYWQALTYTGEDYQIFDNLLDDKQQRWGGYDRRAKDGYSTLLWVPGEVITDRFGVPIDPAAPNGVYTIDIGLYRKTENGAVSLPLVVAGQVSEQKSIRLGPIKVGGPPPEITTLEPELKVSINQSFDRQIILLGYQMAQSKRELKTILYWQAEGTPTADYTTFVHLRDNANQNAAQKDQPPAQGQYPTSLWDAGEIIVDEVTLSLAEVPPGEYTLVVGLYDFATGARLPLVDRIETASTGESSPSAINELPLESVTIP